MSVDKLIPVLETVDLFKGLNRKTVARIAESGRQEEFKPDETVLAQGEEVGGWHRFAQKGVEMHVILTGSAIPSVDGQVHGSLGPGDYFGELSLIDGEPRSADVVAGPDGLTTFAITKWQFEGLLETHPAVAVPMLHVLAARLRAAEHGAN